MVFWFDVSLKNAITGGFRHKETGTWKHSLDFGQFLAMCFRNSLGEFLCKRDVFHAPSKRVSKTCSKKPAEMGVATCVPHSRPTRLCQQTMTTI